MYHTFQYIQISRYSLNTFISRYIQISMKIESWKMNSENWILNNENWILNYENWIRNNELDELSVWSCRFIMDEDKDTVLNLLRYQDVEDADETMCHVQCTTRFEDLKMLCFPEFLEKLIFCNFTSLIRIQHLCNTNSKFLCPISV